ncbi:hypothetical protein HYN59_14830 [Flavobacterium album]|uniref:DUF4760 domain-containing protein n=1 Tax=Flavobacterium album TaxID=2175091 RepID=A0A2S1R0S7_9FLAO|nr:hypothetical protein [Flavobacterium album]AWH86303.1 hypothetical protein HYN59_14830 [Flavobacterium album]
MLSTEDLVTPAATLPLTVGDSMTSSDIIALFATLISIFAFAITFLSYRRERSKSNQDLVFQEKIAAYKDLSRHANILFESFFDLVEDLQDHDGTKKQWTKHLEKECRAYDDQVTKFQEVIFESIPILPEKVYRELIEFGLESRHFITSAFNGDSLLTINAHDKLEKSLRNIIKLMRKDLNVDKVNINLKKRLK